MESRWAGGRTEVCLYVGATVLAIFAPNAAAGFYLVIALVTVARARGDSPSAEPKASRAA